MEFSKAQEHWSTIRWAFHKLGVHGEDGVCVFVCVLDVAYLIVATFVGCFVEISECSKYNGVDAVIKFIWE